VVSVQLLYHNLLSGLSVQQHRVLVANANQSQTYALALIVCLQQVILFARLTHIIQTVRVILMQITNALLEQVCKKHLMAIIV